MCEGLALWRANYLGALGLIRKSGSFASLRQAQGKPHSKGRAARPVESFGVQFTHLGKTATQSQARDPGS